MGCPHARSELSCPQCLLARIAAVEAERDRYRAALTELACYGEGPIVRTDFDCPWCARIAREALEGLMARAQ